MAKSKKKSAPGLLAEAAKKVARGIGDAVKKVVGKKPTRSKSPSGNVSEGAKKGGRAAKDTARKAAGKRPTRAKKSGSK
jgi:hypothetical protein